MSFEGRRGPRQHQPPRGLSLSRPPIPVPGQPRRPAGPRARPPGIPETAQPEAQDLLKLGLVPTKAAHPRGRRASVLLGVSDLGEDVRDQGAHKRPPRCYLAV
jgi:hypothetical protein